MSLKIINADQTAQHLKKPALAAQLAQLEEQYSQFKKLDADYRQRIANDKAEVAKTLTEKLEKDKTEAVSAATAAATAEGEQKLHDSLLALSQFLRLAATRRADDQNAQLDENLALEGILLQVYAGDETGVATMLKLVNGVDEAAKSVTNETLQTTCKFFCLLGSFKGDILTTPQLPRSRLPLLLLHPPTLSMRLLRRLLGRLLRRLLGRLLRRPLPRLPRSSLTRPWPMPA